MLPYTSVILILAAAALYGLVHSWLASLQAKALARRALGPVAERFYRLAYNAFALISLLPVLALPLLLPDQLLYSVPMPWTLVFLGIQSLAALALLVAVLQTGLASFLGLSQLFEAQPSSGGLVLNGLYRWVRHPIYTAGLVFLWFSPRMSLNQLALYAAFSAYFVIGAIFEERKLLREHGAAYRDYQQRTPMLIPGLKR